MQETKFVEGIKVINSYPDLPKEERDMLEQDTVTRLIREYNRLESQKKLKAKDNKN